MGEENMVTPQGQMGGMENAPVRPEGSLLQQFAGYPMSQRPDEKITAEKVKALSSLVGPLDEIENLEAQQAEHEENQKVKASPVQAIIGAIMAASSVIVFIMGIVAFNNSSGDSCGCIAFVFLALLVGGGALGIKGFIDYSTKKKRHKEAEKELPQIYARINQFKTSVDWQILTMMPPAYRNLDALSFTCVAFINGRATTIQEAVNLYEQELHNLKMQNMAAAALLAAEEARISANKAAVSSAAAAGFSALDLFL